MTGILSSPDGNVIRRNAALLPAYSFVLGLIGLLGYMAIAAGVDQNPAPCTRRGLCSRCGSNYAVPALFLESFDSWFVGIACAVAIMSIACANLFTRNLYKEFLSPDCSQAQEANMAKNVSLVVKVRAVVFILTLPQDYAIQLQLLGGIWIIQLLHAILLGLYARWPMRLPQSAPIAANQCFGDARPSTQGG
jgi:SSS family solute:Na+ symporter